MKRLVPAILALTLFISCKGQDAFIETRLKTAEKFIDCLKDNRPDKVINHTYALKARRIRKEYLMRFSFG